MRLLSLFAVMLILICCSPGKKSSSSPSAQTALNGSWTPVKQEMGGKDLPAAVFQSQKLSIQDTSYALQAESLDKGILHYRKGQMDIYKKEGVNTGKHFTAIYKLENGVLTICYNLKGDGYPAGFETRSKAGLFLAVFKKN